MALPFFVDELKRKMIVLGKDELSERDHDDLLVDPIIIADPEIVFRPVRIPANAIQ